MIHSLRARLFLVAAVTLAVALLVVALMTRQAARTEFRQFELTTQLAQADQLARDLTARIAREPEAQRLDAWMEELGRASRRDLLLIGPGGRILAASSAALRNARVTRGAGDRMRIDRDVRTSRGITRASAILMGGMHAVVRRRDGSALGTLVVLPAAEREAEAGRPFGIAFDLRLLIAALAAGLVALALTWWLSRRILRPVDALTLAARRLGGGDLSSRVAVTTRDEIGELSRAFNAMAEDLARQEALRRHLMSDVAHELRTPLTNLRCQIEAVEDGLLDPTPETVRSLREEVLLLARLVEDLQTVAVAEAGRLSLERAPVALGDLVEGALDSVRGAAKERSVTLARSLPETLMVDADPTRIGQVFRNLLANALTATPEGGRVSVSAVKNGQVATVAVADSGHGIPAEHLAHVFERFYRVDPSRARATGGAGLGLAIVKAIVEAHGGTVAVESAVGRGTTFRFTLPLAG